MPVFLGSKNTMSLAWEWAWGGAAAAPTGSSLTASPVSTSSPGSVLPLFSSLSSPSSTESGLRSLVLALLMGAYTFLNNILRLFQFPSLAMKEYSECAQLLHAFISFPSCLFSPTALLTSRQSLAVNCCFAQNGDGSIYNSHPYSFG